MSSPPSKRVKIDGPAAVPSSATQVSNVTTENAPNSSIAEKLNSAESTDDSVTTPVPATTQDEKTFEHETSGLFSSIKSTLGVRASNEIEVGVTEYADNSIPSFAGIIKHRFTDFLVYEVDLQGNVVRLKDIKGPSRKKKPAQQENTSGPSTTDSSATVTDEHKAKAQAQTDTTEPAVAARSTPQSLWSEGAVKVFEPLLTNEKLAEFEVFIAAGPAPSGTPKSTPRRLFRSNVIESKDARTSFHKGLRNTFDGRLASEMKELEDGSQVIEVSWRSQGGGAGRGGPRGTGQGQDRQSKADLQAEREAHPPYIHFTLQKTNKEMHDALAGISRSLHLGPKDIGAAGTKDKRAVTVQRVAIKRGTRTIEDVWRASRGGGGGGRGGRGRGRGGYGGGFNGPERGVRIGDIEYASEMLELGMLQGNKFVVTLRDVTVDSPETIERAITSLSTRGFINYFGMQRFSTGPVPTHVIGLALLRSDWKLATHLVMMPRSGEFDDVAHARQVYKEGNLKEALRLMPRRCVAEKAVLEGLVRCSTDHLSALSRIPKNLRMMYVHAWQSYIWNLVVSERVKLHGCTAPVVGDLVLAEVGGNGNADEVDAAEGADEPSSAVTSLDPILDEEDEPSSAQTATAATMTTSLNGSTFDVQRAIATSRAPKARVLTQQDIDAGTYTIFDVVLPLPGFATKYPEGRLGDRYREIIRADGLDPDDMFRKQKEYSLGGSYRKIFHLATQVKHRLLVYSSPNDDIQQSDEDVLLGRAPPKVVEYDRATMGWPVSDGRSLALQVEMTLGSSTYCTMALREVLKTATSGAHQRDLTEKMEQRLAEEKSSKSHDAEGLGASAGVQEIKDDAESKVSEDVTMS